MVRTVRLCTIPVFRMITILMKRLLLSVLTMIPLFMCSRSGGYFYSYRDRESGPVRAIEARGFRFSLSLQPGVIRDPLGATPLSAVVSFNGEHRFYPRGLAFEIYENGVRIPAGKPQITVTTVINGRVTYFKTTGDVSDIGSVITGVKTEKRLPENLSYYAVSGNVTAPLTKSCCPKKITIKLRTVWDGGETVKEYQFEFGKRELSGPSNRPFG